MDRGNQTTTIDSPPIESVPKGNPEGNKDTPPNVPCETIVTEGSHPEAKSPTLLESLLGEQQSLTVVERFSQSAFAEASPQARVGPPAQAEYYRDLIPLSAPKPGEQYAFEVDLDACSGCKACVAACHNLNGLENDEIWREVGLLVGGSTELPIVQHVTTACHHCVDPACLSGCPVEAYEKDPTTGIVRHLDDQCIGCQYCMLKCPYDVPTYSHSKGIVRKCDMCHDRLAVGEAPACVQSCPNEAIRIRVVDQQTVIDESETDQFLPGAPEPSYTVPTTIYKSRDPIPRNVLPADYFSARRSKSHLPLVFMLVLTQMSVGAFVVDQALYSYLSRFGQEMAISARSLHLGAALFLGFAGLTASIFHLGRPRYAYRALLGLRTSWLSREILAFGLFAAAATLYVTVACLEELPFLKSVTQTRLQTGFGAAAAIAGLISILCSVMVYVDTRRPFWSLGRTSLTFLLSGLTLGIPVALLVSLVASLVSDQLSAGRVMLLCGRPLCQLLIGVVMAKMLVELSIFANLGRRQLTPRKRTALLMTGELSMAVVKRYFFGVVGGIALPLVLLAESSISAESYHPVFLLVATLLILVALTLGELFERYLFFAASVGPKMPGAPAS